MCAVKEQNKQHTCLNIFDTSILPAFSTFNNVLHNKWTQIPTVVCIEASIYVALLDFLANEQCFLWCTQPGANVIMVFRALGPLNVRGCRVKYDSFIFLLHIAGASSLPNKHKNGYFSSNNCACASHCHNRKFILPLLSALTKRLREPSPFSTFVWLTTDWLIRFNMLKQRRGYEKRRNRIFRINVDDFH